MDVLERKRALSYKKSYKRNKRIDLSEDEDDDRYIDHYYRCNCFDCEGNHSAQEDFYFLLNRFGISIETYRVASYG